MALLAAFALWTAALFFVDVQPIGPNGTSVGFAAVNGFFHRLTGVHMGLYTLTDYAGLVPLAIVFCFALLGLLQWINRKSLRAVDRNLFILGGFYVLVFACYLIFEVCIVNYRPVLINGGTEASYPSSTTMLALCVMPSTAIQLRKRIRNAPIRRGITALVYVFMALMLIGRLLSGVHWLSDIIGGALLSAGLVALYAAFIK